MAFTDKQSAFIETLMELSREGFSKKEARSIARDRAGYSSNTPMSDILSDEVCQEIVRRCNQELALSLPEALNKIDDVMQTPSMKGAPVLLAAATTILDRGGLAKKEAQEITIKAPTGLVFIPSKKPLDAEPVEPVETAER